MGLYQLELSRQIHLRNKQKREWEVMKKKEAISQEKKQAQQDLVEKELRAEDAEELQETEISKQLASEMNESARDNSDDTLMRAVNLLHNQNGKCPTDCFLNLYSLLSVQSKKFFSPSGISVMFILFVR